MIIAVLMAYFVAMVVIAVSYTHLYAKQGFGKNR